MLLRKEKEVRLTLSNGEGGMVVKNTDRFAFKDLLSCDCAFFAE
jgi:hypothetical protein